MHLDRGIKSGKDICHESELSRVGTLEELVGRKSL